MDTDTATEPEYLDITWREYAAKYGRAALPETPVDLDALVPWSWIETGTVAA